MVIENQKVKKIYNICLNAKFTNIEEDETLHF